MWRTGSLRVGVCEFVPRDELQAVSEAAAARRPCELRGRLEPALRGPSQRDRATGGRALRRRPHERVQQADEAEAEGLGRPAAGQPAVRLPEAGGEPDPHTCPVSLFLFISTETLTTNTTHGEHTRCTTVLPIITVQECISEHTGQKHRLRESDSDTLNN